MSETIEQTATVATAQPAPSFAAAYQGAMEEVAIWKKRALEAEELNRKFIAEINGPTYMGEPAQPAPSVPDIDYLVDTLSEFADHHVEHGRMSFDKWTLRSAVEAMLSASPEAKP